MVTDPPTTRDVLVADDDDLVRLIISRVLERAGLRVTEAETVNSAIDRCGEIPFALAILDAHMPGGDLATSIGGMRQVRPDLPILILTGDNAPPAEAALQRTTFLSKPVDLAALTAQVGLLLGQAS